VLGHDLQDQVPGRAALGVDLPLGLGLQRGLALLVGARGVLQLGTRRR
jgi:hypothetical protein